MTDNTFRERIINIDRRRVGDVEPNVRNPKRYTDEKNTRLTAVLSQFGKAGVLLTYFDERGVECFFDGNTRSRIDPDEVWYIAQTDLSQKEVDDLVMLYDPLAAPDWDAALFKQLVQETAVTDETLTGMMREIEIELSAYAAAANDPYAEWEGMPEFEQNDMMGAVASIKVHFASINDIEVFSHLIDQSINEKTTYIWFPKQIKENLKKYRSIDES